MHGSRRSTPLKLDAVAVPLAELLDRRSGAHRFGSRAELYDHFMLDDLTAVIASGTDEDKSIERVWGLKDPAAFAKTLMNMGVSAVTSPNFSLFNDVPRWDNLYNMKRIALCWQQFQSAGLHSLLHVNARTDQDWNRWIEFIEARPEISGVAFEFGTGAGAQSREGWHRDQLCRLAQSISRPLELYVRGGLQVLGELRTAFGNANIKMIDSRPFMKAMHRQAGEIAASGKLEWTPAPTAFGQELDDLLALNIFQCRLDVLQGTRRK
nr:DUF4417 domain-containing protein [Solimonas fluminis]